MMDREDIRQSMQVIMNVANDVKNGKNFLIFPEGTRSKNGNVIGEIREEVLRLQPKQGVQSCRLH